MVSIVAKKASLRKSIDQKIKLLTEEYIFDQSKKVIEKVLRHPAYIKAARVSVYLSTPTEINTIPILESALNSSKKCFVPRFVPKSSTMHMMRIHDMDDYNNMPVIMWNIKQPNPTDDREDAFLTGGLDLILLPGVAFTTDGQRLGHGKGYYDTYLHKLAIDCQIKPFTIGLALKEQMVEHLPVTERDYKLDDVLFPD